MVRADRWVPTKVLMGTVRPMADKQRLFITGATGFVGAAVARVALARGHDVTVLKRAATPPTNLAGLDVRVVEGDLNDPDSLARGMDGADALLHVAADYRLWAPNPEEIVQNNLRGTRAIMELAVRHRLKRVVYTSSVAVLAPRTDGVAVDERAVMTPDAAIGAYKRSKILAEQAVLDMVAKDGLPAVIVNPSTPIGPRDLRPTPTGRIIVEAATGKMPAFVDTGLNLVHVDDVAEGHLLAFEKGRVGERYILGGQDVSLQQMLADIARLVGRKPPTVAVPRGLILPIAVVAEAVAKVTKREPFVTVDGLRMSKYRMFFSSAKAEAELGYTARPYGQALADALTWFKTAGYLA